MVAVAPNNPKALAPGASRSAPPEAIGWDGATPLPARRPSPGRHAPPAFWSSGFCSAAFHLVLLGALWLAPTRPPVERVTLSGSRLVLSAEFSESLPAAFSEAVAVELPPAEPPAEQTAPVALLAVELPQVTLDPPEEEPREPLEAETPVVASATNAAPAIEAAEPPEATAEEAPPEAAAPAIASAPAPASATAAPTSAGLDDVTPAKPLHHPPPNYPPEATAKAWSGRVLLRLAIDAEGKVTSVGVVQSSGFRLLDDEAVGAVSRWTFEPARSGGRAVSSTARLPVRFAAR